MFETVVLLSQQFGGGVPTPDWELGAPLPTLREPGRGGAGGARPARGQCTVRSRGRGSCAGRGANTLGTWRGRVRTEHTVAPVTSSRQDDGRRGGGATDGDAETANGGCGSRPAGGT